MADPFQPRFVDLVRNYTSTTGTGNFVLGPAVNGYTGFGSALQPGDSFYYSAIGVDKPAEREVGRGTLQANGSISRAPIAGGLTNFTPGTKTVALIAAAEWFAKVESAAGGSSASASANRPALAAAATSTKAILLTEPGREGLFVFDGSNLASKVAADTAQGVFVPPTSDPTGASGAWVRKFGGEVCVDWFGAVGDGVTDDTPAFVAMRSALGALATSASSGLRRAPDIRLGAKEYFLASDFDCKGFTATWRGSGGGFDYWNNTGSTTIRMASGKSWYFQRADTQGGSTGTTIPYGCDGSVFYDITWRGPGKGVGTASVARMRAKVSLYNCRFIEGGGHGLEIIATAGSGTTSEGNANCWMMVGGACSLNGKSGLYTLGGDANAGTCIGTSFNANAEYGIEEESFLGNAYYGIHCDGNTLGHLHGTGASNTSQFHGYFESGYPPSTIPPSAFATGTGSGGAIDSTGAVLGAANGIITGRNGLCSYKTDGTDSLQCFVGRDLTNAAAREEYYSRFCGGVTPYVERFRGVAGLWGELVSGVGFSEISRSLNGNPGARNHGLATPPVGVWSYRELYLGDGVFPDGRRFVSVSAAPTSGEHAQGEFAFNRGVTAASPLFAWACTATGSPGMHTPLYALTAAPAAIATSGSGADLTNGSVTLAKLGSVADGTILGNNTGATASPVALTAAQVRTLLGLANIATSGSGADLAAGSVTYAKIQNISATSRLLGRVSAGAGSIEEIGLGGGLAMSGGSLTLGAITPSSVASTGAVTSSSATSGVGYTTGAGGAVTQTTNKSTAVTLNKAAGQVTTHNASMSANALISFTVNNSTVAATDTVNLNLASGNATAGTYRHWVEGIAAGSFKIVIENRSGGALAEALVFNFAVLKAVNA